MRYYTHQDCLLHEMSPGHPECPDRLRAVSSHLQHTGILQDLDVCTAPELDPGLLSLAHTNTHVDLLAELDPEEGWVAVDPDTIMNPDTLHAVTMLRRTLTSMHPTEAMEQLVRQLGRFKTNAEFITLISGKMGDL